jgi:hypothetical protein
LFFKEKSVQHVVTTTPRATDYEVANDGDLVELTQDIKKDKEIASFISMIKTKQVAEKKKKAWLYYTLKGVYGEIIAARAFPRLHRQAQFVSQNRPSLSWKKRKPTL